MKNIIVVGTSGCGKTTLAKNLSTILDIPSYDTDTYYWKPNWQAVRKCDFINVMDNLTRNEKWIISGNFSDCNHIIWKRCDTIIWLDYSLLRCLLQAFKRSLKRIIARETCCNGNYETFRIFFSKSSIIVWILTSYVKRKMFYNKIFNTKIDNKEYIKCSTPSQTRKWLEALNKKNSYKN